MLAMQTTPDASYMYCIYAYWNLIFTSLLGKRLVYIQSTNVNIRTLLEYMPTIYMQGIILISRQLYTQKWQILILIIFYIYPQQRSYFVPFVFFWDTKILCKSSRSTKVEVSWEISNIMQNAHATQAIYRRVKIMYKTVSKIYQLYFNTPFNLALFMRARFINTLCNFLSPHNIKLFMDSWKGRLSFYLVTRKYQSVNES